MQLKKKAVMRRVYNAAGGSELLRKTELESGEATQESKNLETDPTEMSIESSERK